MGGRVLEEEEKEGEGEDGERLACGRTAWCLSLFSCYTIFQRNLEGMRARKTKKNATGVAKVFPSFIEKRPKIKHQCTRAAAAK